MVLSIKEILFLIGYIITAISMFLSFRNNQRNHWRQIKSIKDVIFGEKGSLNLVDQKTLDHHLDLLWTRIRQNEAVINLINLKMDDMSDNILAIMITLNVKMPNGRNHDRKRDSAVHSGE